MALPLVQRSPQLHSAQQQPMAEQHAALPLAAPLETQGQATQTVLRDEAAACASPSSSCLPAEPISVAGNDEPPRNAFCDPPGRWPCFDSLDGSAGSLPRRPWRGNTKVYKTWL